VALTNCYTSVAIVNEEIGRSDTDSVKTASLERAINAASRQCDRFTGRPHGFWQDATVVAREYAADDYCRVFTDDISTTTGLIVKTDLDGDGTFETTLTITTDFRLLPFNAADEVPVRPYEQIVIASNANYTFPVYGNGQPGVQVTAKFGWPAVPDDVAQACVLQAIHLFKGPGAAVSGGLSVGFDGGLANMPRMNWMAAALLEPYCKPRVG
jgi:hypothetical protein